MENRDLHRSVAIMRQSLYNEGIVDGRFSALELRHRDYPYVVGATVSGHLNDSTRLLAAFEQEMNTVPIDFSKMHRILLSLRGNSDRIGARKVQYEVDKTRDLLQKGNLEGARVAFQDLRNEHGILKTRLQLYLEKLRLVDLARVAAARM